MASSKFKSFLLLSFLFLVFSLISELVTKLQEAYYFTKLDVHWKFNNILIKLDNKWKTVTKCRLFEPLVIVRRLVLLRLFSSVFLANLCSVILFYYHKINYSLICDIWTLGTLSEIWHSVLLGFLGDLKCLLFYLNSSLVWPIVLPPSRLWWAISSKTL